MNPKQNNKTYHEFAEKFRKLTDEQLLKLLAEQKTKPGWVKAREYYMYYLLAEIRRRGLKEK